MRSLNNLVVIFLAHTPRKCVRVLVSTMSIRLSKDNHDSWGTCTTSAECKTIITVVPTVGMDPHMISENLGWVFVKSRLGCDEVGFIKLWVGHGETS
jgi:hypothetical protein